MGLFLLITPFIYTELVLDPVLVPRIVYFSVVTFFFGVFLAIRVRQRNIDSRVINHPLTWIYLGYILLTSVSVILSVNMGEGIWKFLRTTLFFAMFVMFSLAFFNVEKITRTILYFFLLFAVIVLAKGVSQTIDVITTGPLNHESSYLINSWFAHRNLFAQVLLLTLPFLAMAAYRLGRIIKIIALFLMAVSLIMITLLLVKSVWLALIVAMALSLMLIVVFRKSFYISWPDFKKIGVYTFGAALIVLVSVAVYSRFESAETFKKQTYVLKNYKFGSAIERIYMWEKSLEMFQESPLTGIGEANWPVYLPNYGTAGMRSSQGEIIYQRPHNDFLWVLAENGIVAFIIYALLFLMVLFYQVQIIRKNNNQDTRIFVLSLFFFMISYGIVAFLSFPSERPVPSLLLMIVFAFTLAEYHRVSPPNRGLARSGQLSVLVLFIVLIATTGYVGIRKFESEKHLRNALQYREDNQWQKVIDEIYLADDFFTRLDPTATPLRWYSGLAWYNLGQKEKALHDFRAAYQANPYHMHVLNNLGTVTGEKGDYEDAIKFYSEAVRISPDFNDAVINLSSSLFNIGKTDSAYNVLRSAHEINGHPKYKKVVQVLVYSKVENLKQGIDDRDLTMTLTRIRNSAEWMIKVHEQSIFDGIPLEDHLIVESVYLLQHVDQTIDSSRANYLLKKYLHKE